MNKVIAINLGGNAYQLEESGYDALRSYLDRAALSLKNNPDKDEIVADIEQAIADKFRALLGPNKTVVTVAEVQKVMAEMGPVDDGSGAPAGDGGAPREERQGQSAPAGDAAVPVRRLYRINEGAIIGGVCNGIAAYFNIKVGIVRAAFVVLGVPVLGLGVIGYIALVFLIPEANTRTEREAAHGIPSPSTAEDFVRRARAGYYEAMRAMGDKRAHREWKRRWKREMRGWGYAFEGEMRGAAEQCRQNWHQFWQHQPGTQAGAVFIWPILSLIKAVLFFTWVLAVISLATTGAVFGLNVFAGMPVWVGVLLLIIAYQAVVWPIKAFRHAFFWSRPFGCGPGFPMLWLVDSAIWMGLMIGLIWLAASHYPELRHAIKDAGPALHRAVDAVRHWWAGK